jgi:GABA(A) receptor-associated protein
MEEEGFTHEFQRKIPLEKRKEESRRITQKHPNRIPIIIEKAASCKTIEDIDKKKFLVPDDLTVGQLMFVVRKRLKSLSSEQGLFFFINDSMQPPNAILRTVYHHQRNEDGFLYVLYASENTFG